MLIRKTVSRVDPYHSEVICNEETGRAFNVQRVPFHYRQLKDYRRITAILGEFITGNSTQCTHVTGVWQIQ